MNIIYRMLAKKPKKYSENKTKPKAKTARQIEKHIKGVANHRRIEMLFLIAAHKGISVDSISVSLKCNIKTVSMHLIRLEHAGLIRKRNEGHNVVHNLSPYGKTIYNFLKTFSNS